MKALALAALLAGGAAAAQAPAPPLAADLREEVQRLPVTVKNLYGRSETAAVTLTIYRPPGDGPFPLLVINHGRTDDATRRAAMGRVRFDQQARYFVAKGFAVISPTRIGYGDTVAEFDPEDAGGCSAMRPQPGADAAADQVLAAVALARTWPWIDASRWVVAGQSVGGLTAIAVAARNPPGLVAAINFAGGRGGNPERTPGRPCRPDTLATLWQAQAATTTVPMLWLYWENDLYWGADIPRRWAQAWREGGGRLEFHQLPPAGNDGHAGIYADMDHWVPLVERYLAGAGFDKPGLVERPPASGYARVDETEKVPVSAALQQGQYRRFLAARLPRAFAVGARGAVGWAYGDWAIGRAVGYCQQRSSTPCRLYAVDDDVVWVP